MENNSSYSFDIDNCLNREEILLDFPPFKQTVILEGGFVAMERTSFEQAIRRFSAIPRLNYGVYPTPIEEAPRFRAALGRKAPRIFIKRDDYTGPGFGGNKVRKLEYVLAKAVAEGAEVAITSGGMKSNHARVTAAMCAKLGIRCILVLNPPAVAPPEGLEPASVTVDGLFGAEVVRVNKREERATTVESIAEKLRSEGKNVATIPLGASVPLGAMGFVRAIEETKGQLDAMNTRIDYIIHSSSSGGTQAGVVAGCQLFDWREVKIIGVSPDDPSSSIAEEVGKIVRGIGETLGAHLSEDVTVLDEYVGAGYGVPSSQGAEAIELLARTEGVILDPVYTAKAMAALIDWVRKGELNENDNVMFWHTGGQMALFYAPAG
ncbi:MAG TPA: D-cysteine desulfhydrase family protein [Blastocatellia bacterium]|nr:D-cysteine desulfhydrase family protein [Blastocatellia bacterium]